MKAILLKATFFVSAFALLALLMSGAVMAQTEGAQAEGISNAPISQTLVREGDFAVKLVDTLKLGKTGNEAKAESRLSSLGIAPKNGWIADYPVTPDVAGELQASISTAADSGKLPMARNAALSAFEGVLSGYGLPVKAAGGTQESVEPSEENYPDTTVINNYYYDQGPPVVTYYAPPPDYAYLYTWVPYPFWWANFWFPGYYCLVDFDVVEFDEFHHREFISNHFRDPNTGRFVRIDPTTRARGGVFTRSGGRVLGPSATRGAQSILRRGEISGFRGYGVTRPSSGTRSSAFQRWGSSRFEGEASTRGFQSRSAAGQLPMRSFAAPPPAPSVARPVAPRSFAPQRAPSGRGVYRGGGGFGGFHGSGSFIRGGGFGGGAPRGGGGAPRGGGGGFRR